MSTFQSIDHYLRDYAEKWQIPGLACAIVQNGKLAFSAGYGVQNLQTQTPATPQTLFHIASIAKTMTSTAIMQLREAGKVDLDDPIVKHLPYFRVDDPRSDQITIRQCLCHISGIGHPEDYGWDNPEFDDASLERHVRGLTNHKLIDLAPNTVSYSDIAYNVLGDLISKVSGMSYEEYMRQYIFHPLGMTTTTLMAPRAEHPERVATGYEEKEENAEPRTIVESSYPYNRMHVPCGCIASSAEEMARWMLASLNRGELDGVRILQPESYDVMWQMQLRDSDPEAPDDPALGWWISRRYPERVMQHNGGDDGFLSNLRLWTESNIGIVILCNGYWCDPWNASHEVYRILLEPA